MASDVSMKQNKMWPSASRPRPGHSSGEEPEPPAGQCKGLGPFPNHQSHLVSQSRSLTKYIAP